MQLRTKDEWKPVGASIDCVKKSSAPPWLTACEEATRAGGTTCSVRRELIQRLFETQRELLRWLGANNADSSESGHSF